jgi:serine-type D-Ala-D-Ala carboxypeptidase (penicillin-binding protein 5/6)
MSLLEMIVISVSCLVVQQPIGPCLDQSLGFSQVAGAFAPTPVFTGPSLDVIVSAQAAYVWDIASGEALYEKNADEQRPVASLSKLASALAITSVLQPDQLVLIPPQAAQAQRLGAHIKLPVGEQATAQALLAAGLSASANDAMVALAVASSGSEDNFVDYTNDYLRDLGLQHTQVANATGLSGGVQHSTAREVGQLLRRVYEQSTLGPLLSQKTGVVATQEGTRRPYKTTNELLGTYLPILAAKTGYTRQAGENLAIITEGKQGQLIGVVALGSTQRFQDVKVLVEWIWRNYTWP